MISNVHKTRIGLSVIALVAIGLGWLAFEQWEKNNDQTKSFFIAERKAETHEKMAKINNGFRTIYENLRTLSLLPSLGEIDRHAQNIDADTRMTFQQIYNNLANNIEVSEVYVVPIDFSPEKLDLLTGQLEEPIIMFDSMILNAGAAIDVAQRQLTPESVQEVDHAGPEEVEIFEYRQLVEHANWLKSNYPRRSTIDKLNFPVISGPEVITCDNSFFIKTGSDKDRSGIMLSVPFYGKDGTIRGMISAIVLSNTLRKLLPNDTSALVNVGYNYLTMAPGLAALTDSMSYINQAKPDESLIYSEVIPVDLKESRTPWIVWSGVKNEIYLNSSAVQYSKWTFIRTLFVIAVLWGLLTIAYFLFLRNLSQAQLLNKAMSTEIALNASKQNEKMAILRAEVLAEQKQEIENLNFNLAKNISALKSAQDEIVQKSKMAMLGSLVATVAHEIRNPLGAVRTSAFTLKRKMNNAPADIVKAITRIETGVSRCDNLISQLLDFSRTTQPQGKDVVVDDWLVEVIKQLAKNLPPNVVVNCNLGLGSLSANFDPERLSRVIANLVNNAADALVDHKTGKQVVEGRTPMINITTAKSQRGFEVSIDDNGPGIQTEVFEKIRDPLFTTKSFGAGLGIPASEKIVELHGGKLQIETVLGRGTKFSFHIPENMQEQILN